MVLVTGFEWYWSWVLSTIPLFAFWQVGNRRRWAFLVMASGEIVWIVWAMLTRQWGFIPGSVVFGAVAIRNWSHWVHHPTNPADGDLTPAATHGRSVPSPTDNAPLAQGSCGAQSRAG
jgi:hypothetical protein